MSSTLLYFDCFSGISGDMTVAALLDLGADFTALERELLKLGLDGEYELRLERVERTGISAAKFDVRLARESGGEHAGHGRAHDHDHGHDHDHDHGEHAGHGHAHGHAHAHGHDHDHGEHAGHGHAHDHVHRAYRDIVALISAAHFEERVARRALAIFERIARAEAKIHGVELSDVHFHEVGAVDSIIDIVSVAYLLDALGVERIAASPVPTGCGFVKTMHGLYPVPAPATLELLRGYPIAPSEVDGELTTPTGAAFLAELATERGPIPAMSVDAVGYGAGSREYDGRPNVLRALLGKP